MNRIITVVAALLLAKLLTMQAAVLFPFHAPADSGQQFFRFTDHVNEHMEEAVQSYSLCMSLFGAAAFIALLFVLTGLGNLIDRQRRRH
jgi:hypothetical protein